MTALVHVPRWPCKGARGVAGGGAGCDHKPERDREREREAIKWPWKIYRLRGEEEEREEAGGDNVRGGRKRPESHES